MLRFPILSIRRLHIPFSRSVSLFSRLRPAADEETPGGVFGLKGLHRPNDWARIAESCVDDCLDLADKIRRHEPSRNAAVLQTFDDLSNRLCSVLDVAELCRNVHPDPEFVDAANDAFVNVSGVIQHLNADYSLYQPLNVLYHENEGARKSGTGAGFLSDEDVVMVKSLKQDFERGGINLGAVEKKRLIGLQERVNTFGAEFISSRSGQPPLLELPESKLRQVPLSARQNFKSSAKPQHLQVPVDGPMAQVLLKWVPDSRVREQIFRLMHGHQAESNMNALDSLLEHRREIANVLGHSSYAELLFGDRVASSPNDVLEFLQQLSRFVQDTAHQDRNAIEIEKLRLEPHTGHNGQVAVHGWDRSFYIGRLKAQNFDLSSAEVSNYLPLSSCLAGLSDIVENVFGVKMVRVNPTDEEIWHEDVEKVLLVDESGQELGYIFLDLYPREGKYGHAAHFSITCGRQPVSGDAYQTPVVALVCNFGKGSLDDERLLTISEYETLFHEFGHSLHSILSRTKYQHLSGTRVTTDFVEVPSHLFEHFAWDPRIISRFARHHRTGDPMPTRLIRALCASRKGFIATDIEMQLLFSAMDLCFHGPDPPLGSTTAAFETLQAQLTSYQPDRGVPVPATFHHFVGYGAGYYSYIFARVISAQLWSSLFEQNPLSRRGGLKLRNRLLAKGGAHDSSSLIYNVLNHDVSCVPFLRSTGINVSDYQVSLNLPISKPRT